MAAERHPRAGTLHHFFQTCDKHEKDQQLARDAERFASEHATQPKAAAVLKRAPGRPKRAREASETLLAASAAEAKLHVLTTAGASVRGEYVDWFQSEHIVQILRAYLRFNGSAKLTVRHLHQTSNGTFAGLAESTIRHWWEKDDKMELRPQYKAALLRGLTVRRGAGRPAFFASIPAVEEELMETLKKMREGGAPVTCSIVRCVMEAIVTQRAPDRLAAMPQSQQWASWWVRQEGGLHWSWRKRTTDGSAMPLDWQTRGAEMGRRIGALMQIHNIHASLVVNLDQTGLNLVPSSQYTYEMVNERWVEITGSGDKRQITAVLASSLHGDLLPLQLVFGGTTPRCHPEETPNSKAARVHITHSHNHWSSLETMQQWVQHVLIPYAERCVNQFSLNSDARVLLILDCWSVHKSKSFLDWIAGQPYGRRIHVVFVPARCTSKLQVADVALQRPFKAHIRNSFSKWTAETMMRQIQANEAPNMHVHYKMATIKPLTLDWSVASWHSLNADKSTIAQGWHNAVLRQYDVNNREKRIEAMAAVAAKQLNIEFVEDGEECEEDLIREANAVEGEAEESDHEENELQDMLDLAKPITTGERRSKRAKTHSKPFGFQLDSSAISGFGSFKL